MNDVPVSLEKQNTRFEESETPELSNVRKRFLLFADDLTIFSHIRNELQRKYTFLSSKEKMLVLKI